MEIQPSVQTAGFQVTRWAYEKSQQFQNYLTIFWSTTLQYVPSFTFSKCSLIFKFYLSKNCREWKGLWSHPVKHCHAWLCVYTHKKIHICTRVCVHIYICAYIYITFPQFLFGYLRENVTRYPVLEKNFQTSFSLKTMWWRWGHNHSTLFSGKSPQIRAIAHKLLSIYLQNPFSPSSHPLLQGIGLEIHTVLP